MTSETLTVQARPAHRIRSVSVIGGFLDGARLDFADGLNCIIGGRGTGKTTILEFVRYAFDALPSRDVDPIERRRIEGLVEQNLGGGRVQVAFQTRNGLTYIVSRSWGEHPVVLTADGLPTQLTLKSGGVFRADIYSQNEVERIADLTTSQLVLIDRFHADAIAEIEVQLRDLERDITTNANQLLTLEARHDELREEAATLPEVEEQLKAFEGSGGEDSSAINKAHAGKAHRDRERRAMEFVQDDLLEFQERLRSQSGWIAARANAHLTGDLLAGPNRDALTGIAKRLAACSQAVDHLLRQAQDQLAQALQQIEKLNETLGTIHDQQELAFRELIEKHEHVMEQATERAQLQRVRNDLLAKKRVLEEVTGQLIAARASRAKSLERLSELRDQRFAIRLAVTERINSAVSPMIRVGLEQFGEIEKYEELLTDALRGGGMQHKIVAQKIASSVPPRDLSEIVKNRDAHALVNQAGINAAQAVKVIESLNSHEVLFDLELVEMNDKPRIELRDGDSYKDALTLSTGQKCTSILPILLLDSDRPLLVDQPEDNLDNAFIYETVVTRLNQVKTARQLIFVTHNPNIPVLGEASQVFVFKSNGTKGWVEKEGTVDDCRSYIVNLLEGGEEAFKLRQHKYNY